MDRDGAVVEPAAMPQRRAYDKDWETRRAFAEEAGELRLDRVEAEILGAFPRAEIMIHQDPEGIEEPRQSFPPATGSSRLAS